MASSRNNVIVAAIAIAAIAYASPVVADAMSGTATTPGSCLIAGAAFAGPKVVAAAAQEAIPVEEVSKANAPRAAGSDDGVCTAALPAPGSGMTVAGASNKAGDAGVATLAAEEVRTANEPAPRAAGERVRNPPAKTPAVKKKLPIVAPPMAPLPVAPESERKIWWPAMTQGKLNLRYAGQASFCTAIALLFDGTFETSDSANRNIQVRNSRGRAVAGRWVVASNRQMLLFKAAPGRYSIDVGSGLFDQGGRAVAAHSAGPVYLR